MRLITGPSRAADEGSLRGPGTDRIDLNYTHVDDAATPLEETLGAFDGIAAERGIRLTAAAKAATIAPDLLSLEEDR